MKRSIINRKKILIPGAGTGIGESIAKEGLETFAKNSNKDYLQVLQEQMSLVPLSKMSGPGEVGALVNYLFMHNKSITVQSFDINNGA